MAATGSAANASPAPTIVLAMAFSPAAILCPSRAIDKRREPPVVHHGQGQPPIALAPRAAKARPMSGRDCDIAIVGGGLAGGLLARALAPSRSDLALRLIECGPTRAGHP